MRQPSNASLQVEIGLNSPSTINLDSPSVVFGSSQAADATIEPEFVSRRHFQIRSQDGVYYITDLESTNGTYLNGERLPTNVERRVKDGDRIGLAVEAVVLRFIDPVGTVKIDTSTPMISGPPNPDQDKKGLVVDLASRDVWVRGQKQDPPLSRKEFDILETLYRNRGNAVNREDIGKAGWPERGDARVSDEEIDQYILRLRRRIETNPSSPTLIVTLRGFGFRMP